MSNDLLRRLAQCIGLASLLLVMNYGDLLGGGADVRMHVPFALGGIVAAQAADVVLLGLVLFGLVMALRRTRFYEWGRLLLLLLLMPPYLLERTRGLFGLEDGTVEWFAVLWAALLLLLLLNFPRAYRGLLRAANVVGLFFAIFALCSAVQLAWVAFWKPGPQQIVAQWSQTPQPPREHPKLVWIIFDELSYDQLFEHRAHDLALPNFDALRGESTLFTDVQPVGYRTVNVIPSLLSGRVVDGTRFTFRNGFEVHHPGQPGAHALDGGATVFHVAQAAGWRTAVVGWYNPYCTIYGSALDSCYFMNLDRIDGFMAQRDSFWRNTWSPLQQMVREVKAPARADRDACNYDVRQRYKTHIDLESQANALLTNDQADMVFLHMGVPHSPNIWSRLDDAYTQVCGSSYLDNLALADRMLGRMLQILRSSPRWKNTTVIVEGDHGWRIDLWNGFVSWTDEDTAAARGAFDPRPALLIHQAGETDPRTDASAWPLLRVHDVVEQVLHGQPPSL